MRSVYSTVNDFDLKLDNIILSSTWDLVFTYLQIVIFTRLFSRSPTLWNSMLKVTILFRRWLTLLISTLKLDDNVDSLLFPRRCKFQRWHTQSWNMCWVASLIRPFFLLEKRRKEILECCPWRENNHRSLCYCTFWNVPYQTLKSLRNLKNLIKGKIN